jgi:hypothetical protein
MRYYWKLAIGHAATRKRFGGYIRASDRPAQYGQLYPGLESQGEGDASESESSERSGIDSDSDRED